MRGKALIWGTACALLAAAILPVLAGGALADDCTTVSATVTDDQGARREVCPPGGSGSSPGEDIWGLLADLATDPGTDPGDPPAIDGVGAGASLVDDLAGFLGDFERSVDVCRTIFESENADRESTEITVCAHAEADPPSEGGDHDADLESCQVQDREGFDPAVHYGDGGAAACGTADVRPGGLVDVDTDDCPSDDPGDPTVSFGDTSVQICPRDIHNLVDRVAPGDPDLGDDGDDSDDGDGDDPTSEVPPLPSNDEGVYSMIGDAGDSAGDADPPPGGEVPSTHVDDERCPNDMIGDSSVHVGSWTVWVCVHDPTA